MDTRKIILVLVVAAFGLALPRAGSAVVTTPTNYPDFTALANGIDAETPFASFGVLPWYFNATAVDGGIFGLTNGIIDGAELALLSEILSDTGYNSITHAAYGGQGLHDIVYNAFTGNLAQFNLDIHMYLTAIAAGVGYVGPGGNWKVDPFLLAVGAGGYPLLGIPPTADPLQSLQILYMTVGFLGFDWRVTTVADVEEMVCALLTIGDGSVTIPFTASGSLGLGYFFGLQQYDVNSIGFANVFGGNIMGGVYTTLADLLGPNGDADGDGVTNKIEYDCNGSTNYVSAALDPAQTVPVGSVVALAVLAGLLAATGAMLEERRR